MDFSFTPSRSPETCQLSPTHLRNVSSYLDLRNIDRNIRRSMSRSPSRFSRPTSNSPVHSPAISAPRSPLRHHASTSTLAASPTYGNENGPTSSRKTRSNRPALTRSTPIRGLFKTAQMQAQTLPQTPGHPQPLGDSSDFGNSPARDLQDNHKNLAPSGAPQDSFENALMPSQTRTIPIRTPSTRARSVVSKELTHARDWVPAKSSPLKRGDGGNMSRDSDNNSPSAKRRSLNGASSDSNEELRPTDSDQIHTDEDISSDEAQFRASLPPSAFRKSLMNNRGSGKSNPSRNRRSLESGTPSSTPKRSSVRPRPRTSFDSLTPRIESSDRSMFLDANLGDIPRPLHVNRSTRQHPHPLSQALSPNSPLPQRPGVPAETSTVDTFTFEKPSTFSKSLPVGALRPQQSKFVQESAAQSFATPKAFEDVRPDPAAFRSTGLISKRYRHPDDMPPPPGGRDMPDTPCKRSTYPIHQLPSSPAQATSIPKPRFGQLAFDTPSRPSGMHASRQLPGGLSKSVGFFDRATAKPSFDRRASFTSNDSEEFPQSPSRVRESQPDSHSSADELPPTPTKQNPQPSAGKPNSLRSSLFGRRTPAPVNADTFANPELPEQSSFSKSVIGERPPQTPVVDHGIPDPSYLSISPGNNVPRSPDLRSSFRTSIIHTPATPSHRDSMTGPISTPGHHGLQRDVDGALVSKFKRVEWHARGEFSDVYKVFEAPVSRNYFSPTNNGKAQWTPIPDRVFMVKKSRSPYLSQSNRDKQLREPQIMKALGKSDHVVELLDFWEADNFLYMQMEFCEEGTLHAFLGKQGSYCRLDDFRIWKILLELCLGVKHIHDNNFMHLDLKPENVLIDFEGTLKIGDFGLASAWPAPRHLEGEGDRRYISQDLLHGAFDKPADVFALGMMMYETATNTIPPDNGGHWQILRSGDFSGLHSLTSADSLDSDAPAYLKSASANMELEESRSRESLFGPAEGSHASIDTRMSSWEGGPLLLDRFGAKDTELATPPSFVLDPNDANSLDRIVQWMMLPKSGDRPTVDQLLAVAGCQWVSNRRRSGAVIFEGRWGPADHMLPPSPVDEDSIMTDV